MAATTTTYAAATATAGLVLLLRFHLALAVAFTGDPLLLACGAPAPIALPDGRVFLPDSNVSISPAHASRATAITAAPASSPLYSTARAFSANATYSLPIPLSPHRHLLLRLHFPQPAQFAVAAGDLELVSDPRPASRSTRLHDRYREYLLPHRGGGLLQLRVSPRPGSLALLNAVELFPAPDALLPLSLPGDFRLAETFYRVNAGAASGEAASSLNDSFWRLWEGDAAYLLNPAAARSVSVDPASVRYPAGAAPPYAAPAGVYSRAQEMADARVGNQRFNLSWAFPVDPGFRYSVRLHLCDIVGRNSTDLVFDVYINGDAVLNSFDLSGKLGLFNAYFVDFIAAVPPGSEKILLQLGPPRLSYSKPNAILNGVEIMKLGDRETALRADDLTTAPPSKVHKKKIAIVTAEAAGGAILITICIVGMLLFFRRRRRKKRRFLSRQPSSSIGLHTHTGISASKVSAARIRTSSGSSLTIGQIRQATNGFDESLVIGSGGFGKVYRGVLENGATVAVKRGNPQSRQGLLEFRTEVQMLSKLRHRHLVSLAGHCHEAGEMVLVYEFMAGGSLQSHLYGCPALPPLSWKQRLEACVGAAKGLHYLHTGVSKTTIIHRDIKTANILLDGALSAKVSGFGLSLSAPAEHEVRDDATAKGGSSGHLDPDRPRRQRLTDKSDVYSFGVVLKEVLCARPAGDPVCPRGHQAIVMDRAMERRRLGELERVMDPHLAGGVDAGSLCKFGETVEKCLAEHGVDRPTMGDVLWNLECTLRMQEAFLSSGGEGSSGCGGTCGGGQELLGRDRRAGGDGGCGVAGDVREAGVATGVFSQILDPKGR